MQVITRDFIKLVQRTDQWDIVFGILKRQPEFKAVRFERFNESLLHWGALSSIKVVYDLLSMGFVLNDLDSQGKTPLDWTLQSIYFAQTEGVDKNPMGIKKMAELIDVAGVLLSLGGKINQGKTAFDCFDLMLRNGNFDLVVKIIENNSVVFCQRHIDSLCLGIPYFLNKNKAEDLYSLIINSLLKQTNLNNDYFCIRMLQCYFDNFITVEQLCEVISKFNDYFDFTKSIDKLNSENVSTEKLVLLEEHLCTIF